MVVCDGKGGRAAQTSERAERARLRGVPRMLNHGKHSKEYPISMAGDAVMQADHHHSPPLSVFPIKLVELIVQRLFVSGCVPALEREGGNVVHVDSTKLGPVLSVCLKFIDYFSRSGLHI
jgi:hypothetical protein